MLALTSVSLQSSALFTLFWTTFQQSIITEPIIRILELLLCGKTTLARYIQPRTLIYWILRLACGYVCECSAVNKETSVQKVSRHAHTFESERWVALTMKAFCVYSLFRN